MATGATLPLVQLPPPQGPHPHWPPTLWDQCSSATRPRKCAGVTGLPETPCWPCHPLPAPGVGGLSPETFLSESGGLCAIVFLTILLQILVVRKAFAAVIERVPSGPSCSLGSDISLTETRHTDVYTRLQGSGVLSRMPALSQSGVRSRLDKSENLQTSCGCWHRRLNKLGVSENASWVCGAEARGGGQCPPQLHRPSIPHPHEPAASENQGSSS